MPPFFAPKRPFAREIIVRSPGKCAKSRKVSPCGVQEALLYCPTKISVQGEVKFLTGGDTHAARSGKAKSATLAGCKQAAPGRSVATRQADLVRIQDQRLQSGWKNRSTRAHGPGRCLLRHSAAPRMYGSASSNCIPFVAYQRPQIPCGRFFMPGPRRVAARERAPYGRHTRTTMRGERGCRSAGRRCGESVLRR